MGEDSEGILGETILSTFFPVQPVDVRVIPEAVYRAAYEVYCYLYGPQPAMVDIEKGCRGGFTPGELIAVSLR